MTGLLNETAIRAWQNTKGALSASATGQTKSSQYVTLYLMLQENTKS